MAGGSSCRRRRRKSRGTRWLNATALAESIGDGVARQVLPIVAVSVLGAGAGLVGVLNSLGLAAFLLLSFPIGVLADRRGNPLRFMGLGTLVRAEVAVVGVLLWGTGLLTGWGGLAALVAMAAVVGTADVAFTTGQGLLVPRLVEPQQIRWVYGRVQAMTQGGGAAAPLLVAGVLLLAPVPVAWIGAAAAYLISAAAQRRIGPLTPMRPPVRSSLWAEAKRGIGHLFGQPLLARVTVANALSNAAVMGANTLLPVIALSEVGVAPAAFAAIGAAAAVCGMAGAAMAARISERVGLRLTRVAVASAMVVGNGLVIGTLAGALPGRPEIWLVIQAAIAGAGSAIAMVAGSDLPARLVPAGQLGAVMGAQRAIVLGAMPVAALTFGGLAVTLGLLPTAWVWLALTLSSVIPCLQLTDGPSQR